MQLNIS